MVWRRSGILGWKSLSFERKVVFGGEDFLFWGAKGYTVGENVLSSGGVELCDFGKTSGVLRRECPMLGRQVAFGGRKCGVFRGNILCCGRNCPIVWREVVL